MEIKKIIEEKNLTFSLEIFPPKEYTSIASIYATIDELATLNPDFISVTYGSGGTGAINHTKTIASYIKNQTNIEPLAHLTGAGAKKSDISKIISSLLDSNINNVLALRGDDVGGIHLGDFLYASDLIKYISEISDIKIAGACYPEKHPESLNLASELNHLKMKTDAGADFLITQLFLNNEYFYDFMEEKEKSGIDTPVLAGIMPVINKRQIERITTLCGATLPKKFKNILDKYGDNDEALFDAGTAYATEQIIDLITSGVDGIHLYTMNNPRVAMNIYNNISNIIKAENS